MISQRNNSQKRLINIKKNKSYQFNQRGKLLSILKRISEKYTKINPTLYQLKEKRLNSYIYQIKPKEKSDFNEITKNMSKQEEKLILNVNEIKRNMNDYIKMQQQNVKQYNLTRKENSIFSKMYKNLKNNKKKRGDEDLLENKFYFDIANKYLLNEIRLPNMKRNIFNTNPLILDNENIKEYFQNNNNKGSKKLLKFLEKLKDISFRKITRNNKMSVEEEKHLEKIKNEEKPKGYIPPEKLIPDLKKDISKLNFSYNCLINEYKNQTIEDLSYYNNDNTISKNSFDNKAIFPLKRPSYDLAKIRLKIINYKINNNNSNNKNSFSINNSSFDTTTIPLDTKNNNLKTPKYNIFQRKNIRTMILASPLIKNIQSHTSKVVDIIGNDDEKNNNINNSFIDKELNNSIPLKNSKLKLFSPKKKIDFTKLRDKTRIIPYKININHDSQKTLDKLDTEDLLMNNESIDMFKKKSNQKQIESPKKINLNSKFDLFQKQTPKLIQQRNIIKQENKNEKEQNIEKLYNKALNLNSSSKSLEDQVELENYLISYTGKKKKKINDIINLRNTYYNMKRIENRFSKNLINKSYTLKNNGYTYAIYDDNANNIIKKNEMFNQMISRNSSLFTKVICERDKDKYD